MIDWQFKRDAKPQGSIAGFWHGITYGRCIDVGLLLEDESQVNKVKEAVVTLKSFEKALEDSGLLLYEF